MKRQKKGMNSGLIKDILTNRLIFFILISALIFIGCNLGGDNEKTASSFTTITQPSGYLEVTVSPGDIITDIREDVTISCSITPLINTQIDISSIELALFDTNDSMIRTEPMNLEDYWSANITYTIVGDEASYRLLINFSINPSNPEYFSDYTDAFSIKTAHSSTTITEPSGYLGVSVSPGDIIANIGEEVTISCSIMPLINTPVDISTIELVLFDTNDSMIRTEPMNLEDYWSANIIYTIVGDEASYRLLINFSINPSNPEYFSDYTDAFRMNISL